MTIIQGTATPTRLRCDPEALQVETKDAGSGLGTGGMSTKIQAASAASVAGAMFDLLETRPRARS